MTDTATVETLTARQREVLTFIRAAEAHGIPVEIIRPKEAA